MHASKSGKIRTKFLTWNSALAVALSLSVMPSATMAQEISDQFRTPAPGTELTYACSDGERRITIDKATGLQVRWRKNERLYENMTLFCWACGRGISVERTQVAAIYPLISGKIVGFRRHKGDRAWTDTVFVMGTETIDTPAGRFDTYVVQTRSESDEGWTGMRTAHYAPSLGWVVRVTKEQSGRKPTSCELEAVAEPTT